MPRKNKGPKLEPNENGRYEIRWTEHGRSRRRSTGTQDFEQAQKVLANFILLKDRADDRDMGGVMLASDALGDYDAPSGADYWHDHVVPNVIDKDSVRYAYDKLHQHFGHLAIADIDPTDVQDYVDKRRRGEIGRPSVNHTISKELAFLNAAFAHAVKAKRLSAADKPFIKLPGHSPPRDRWLSFDEAMRLMDAALEEVDRHQAKDKLPRVYRFCLTLFTTASRKSAGLELQRRQVSLSQRLIQLNPEGRNQTNKRRPAVPIGDDFMPMWERVMNEIPDDPDAYICDHPGAIRTAFANAVARAGLGKDVTPHVLRHTKATWMAQAGVSMFEIAGILGDTIETVTKTYAHHHPDHLRYAANAVKFPHPKPRLRVVR